MTGSPSQDRRGWERPFFYSRCSGTKDGLICSSHLKKINTLHIWLFKGTLTRVRIEGRLTDGWSLHQLVQHLWLFNSESTQPRDFHLGNLRWLFLFSSERSLESSFMPQTSQFLFSFQMSQQFCRCTVVIESWCSTFWENSGRMTESGEKL